MSLPGELRAGVTALGLTLQQTQLDQLLEYLYLIERWNKTYNLTAIREPARMLTHHIFDSLSILPAIEGCRKALDVGSGAGLPGIPLAIALPDSIWILLDSNAKKTRFLRQAVAHCGLRNVQVVQARLQDYHAPDSLDIIVSRAFAPLAEFCEDAAHLLTSNTRMLTMKAGLKSKEILQLDPKRFAYEETPLEVPGIDQPRSLVTIVAK